MEIFTVGFTQKSAAEFFGLLKGAGIRQLLDIRLNNVSQLVAFQKPSDTARRHWLHVNNLRFEQQPLW